MNHNFGKTCRLITYTHFFINSLCSRSKLRQKSLLGKGSLWRFKSTIVTQ